VLSVTPLPEQSSQGHNLPVVTLLANPRKWTYWRRQIPAAACGSLCGTRSTRARTGAAHVAWHVSFAAAPKATSPIIVNRFESILESNQCS